MDKVKAILERLRLEATRLGEIILSVLRSGGWRSGIAIGAVAGGVVLAVVLWLTLTAEETVTQRQARIPEVELDVPRQGEINRLGQDEGETSADESPSTAPSAGLDTPGGGVSRDRRPNPVDEALLGESPYGALPRRSPDGRLPWQYYAHPFDGSFDDPLVAFVLTELGLNEAISETILAEIPPEVTLAFQPYSPSLTQWLRRARRSGHETLLMVPMEPIAYPRNDPGPRTLLTTLRAEQNIDRLEWLLSRARGYIGVTDYMGERFLPVREELAPVIEAIGRRGLLFFDSGRVQTSTAMATAREKGVAAGRADEVLDSQPDAQAVNQAIDAVVAEAQRSGSAIGVGRAYPVTVRGLRERLGSLESVTLAPLSVVVAKRLGGSQS